jgi:hypothetical protein
MAQLPLLLEVCNSDGKSQDACPVVVVVGGPCYYALAFVAAHYQLLQSCIIFVQLPHGAQL